jgi:hypothetical protein
MGWVRGGRACRWRGSRRRRRLAGAGVARLGDWGVVRQADDRSLFSADAFLHFPSNGVRAHPSLRETKRTPQPHNLLTRKASHRCVWILRSNFGARCFRIWKPNFDMWRAWTSKSNYGARCAWVSRSNFETWCASVSRSNFEARCTRATQIRLGGAMRTDYSNPT